MLKDLLLLAILRKEWRDVGIYTVDTSQYVYQSIAHLQEFLPLFLRDNELKSMLKN